MLKRSLALVLGVFFGWHLSVSASPISGGATLITTDGAHDPNWRISTSGEFKGWCDRRNLITLSHPFAPSTADTSASATHTFALPTDVSGPLHLHFYMSDTYDGQSVRLAEDWLGKPDFRGQLTLKGHRYKQVLVDGAVIWEEDVADGAGPSARKYHSALLPEGLDPNVEHEVSFRVLDKVGSEIRLSGDTRFIGEQEVHAIAESDPWSFPTNVYVGDIMITANGAAVAPAMKAPMREAVEARHEGRWPLRPISDAVPYPVTLQVQGAPASQEPRVVHGGVPLPLGMTTRAQDIALALPGGALPVQTRAMNHWPDGSLRWVEIATVLPAGTNEVNLTLRPPGEGASPTVVTPVTVVHEPNGGVSLKTGTFEATCGPAGSAVGLTLRSGEAVLADLHGQVEIAGTHYEPVVDEICVLDEGPIRCEVGFSGLMRGGEPPGRFEFRVAAFAGQPYVRVTWRIFNDRAETLDVARWELVGTAMGGESARVSYDVGQPPREGDVWVRQADADTYTVRVNGGAAESAGTRAAGWLGVSGVRQTVVVGVRHFSEQFPTALGFESGRLHIRFFEPSEALPLYQPHEGEAKREEVWLGVWDKALPPSRIESITAQWQVPTRLFNADYYCATGALGEASPHDATRFAELTAIMARRHAGDRANLEDPNHAEAVSGYGIRHGIRHWGDSPYGTDHWCNGYYDRQQGFAVEYLMTGGGEWFQRLEATVRHIIDVDICHHSDEHPEWVGAIHSLYADDHSAGGISSAPWPPGQRTKGMLAYWRYTADDVARESALGVADSAIRSQRAMGASSVRDHGGILYCLVAAYDETGNAKYLDAARAVAHDSFRCIDSRRGAYEELHGNMNLYGGLPWLQAQLAEPLYEYYRISGDVEAAVAVVGIAESIMTENAVDCDPSTMYGYSFNPIWRSGVTSSAGLSGYDVLVAPVFMYAYDLTGDRSFLEFARSLYKRTIADESVNSVANCYWNTDSLLYFLQAFSDE